MKMSPGRLFIAGSTLLVVAVVIVGVFLAGSPHQARVRGLDQQRIQALTRLSDAIERYHDDHRALPRSLDVAAAAEPGIAAADLSDPEDGALYEYRTTDEDNYELCARFGAGSEPDDAIRWRHGPGRTCFAFTAPPPGATRLRRAEP